MIKLDICFNVLSIWDKSFRQTYIEELKTKRTTCIFAFKPLSMLIFLNLSSKIISLLLLLAHQYRIICASLSHRHYTVIARMCVSKAYFHHPTHHLTQKIIFFLKKHRNIASESGWGELSTKHFISGLNPSI